MLTASTSQSPDQPAKHQSAAVNAATVVAFGATMPNDEAARYLGVSPATLATWRSTRDVEINFCRIGRRVVYRRVDLDKFLADHLVGTGA